MDRLKVGVTKKEIAARAVLRDAWQNGHRCVELQQDGRAFIFFCTLCSTRCYSDASLGDHLRGNQHARRLTSTLLSSSQSFASEEGLFTDLEKLASASIVKSKSEFFAPSKTCSEPDSIGLFPPSSLEWIGSGQVFLNEGPSEPSQQVQQVWCQWYGRSGAVERCDPRTGKKPEELPHAVVVFPYSDAIGRQGDWKPSCFVKIGDAPVKEKPRFSEPRRRIVKSCDSSSLSSQGKEDLFFWEPTIGEEEGKGYLVSKDLTQKALLKALKRRRMNMLERLCFICHQQMLPGKDVAALLNSKTGQMMCSSRNERGAFHVFHTSCLIDWILLCESKFWSARAVKNNAPRMRGQINKKPRRGKAKATIQSSGPLFCPECQGTGVEVHSHQLEQPRYRLAQVFDWILELIQARRSWISHSEQQHKKCRGLFFLSEVHCGDTALSLGTLEFYAAGSVEFLASAALTKLPSYGA
eukprot:c37497_g1_i1 orf=253-1653(-)